MPIKPKPLKKRVPDFSFIITYEGEIIEEGNQLKKLPFHDPTFKRGLTSYRAYSILPTEDDSVTPIVITGPDLSPSQRITADLSDYWDDEEYDPYEVTTSADKVEFLTAEDPVRNPIVVEDVSIRRNRYLTDDEVRDLALDQAQYIKGLRRAHVSSIEGRSRWERGQGSGAFLTGLGTILESSALVIGACGNTLVGVLSFLASLTQGIVTIVVHTLGGSTQLGSSILNLLFGTVNVLGQLFRVVIEVSFRLIVFPFQLLLSLHTVNSNRDVNHRHAVAQERVAFTNAQAARDVAWMDTGGCIGRLLGIVFTIFLLVLVLALLI